MGRFINIKYKTIFKEINMSLGKKGIVYILGLDGISKIITYFLLLTLANLYSVSSYGKASYVLAFFYIVMIFANFGLPNIFVPWIINKKDTHSVFYFLISLNILFFISGIIISVSYPWVLPLVLVLPILLFYYIGFSLLNVEYRYHIVKFFNVIFIIITLVSVFLLKDLDKFGIILGYSVAYLLSSLGVIYLTKKGIYKIISRFSFNWVVIKEYIKKSFISSLLGVSFVFLNWVDSIILGWLSTFENVARYNVASSIANVIVAIPLAISFFLLTRTSELVSDKKVKISEVVLSRAIRISYSFSLLISIFINTFMVFFIKIFFPKYVGVEIYASILSMGVLFLSAYTLITIYFTGRLEPEKSFTPIISAALFNLVFDILLIPYFGLFGICIATTFAHILAFSLLIRKANLVKEFIWVYPLSFIIPLIYYLSYYGLLLIPIVIPILFLLKLINLDDIKVIKETVFNILHIK